MEGKDGEALDEYLDRVLIGGREECDIRVVKYSELWPRRFETERRRIEGSLGETARRVEHIGSTAVAGLAAKPIVDIMVSIDDPEDSRPTFRNLRGRLRAPGSRIGAPHVPNAGPRRPRSRLAGRGPR